MSTRIRVGIDAANILGDRRGIGRYVRSLVDAWSGRFRERVDIVLLLPDLFPSLARRRLEEATGVAGLHVARRSDAKKSGAEVVWYPWNGMTWVAPAPSVVTVHDLWPFVSPAADERTRAREQSHYRRALASATRFIAVSRFTAGELVARLGVDPARIEVIPHGVPRLTTADVVPARSPDGGRYILFVGEAEPRKGLATLVDAVSLLAPALRSSIVLCVAGKTDNTMTGMFKARDVRYDIEGEVSDERLASLYAGAAAFVFPSRYEGFGLPVLEAMSFGVPVVTSDAPALVETAGGAGLTFPAGDAPALAHALERVLDDRALAQRLSDAGRARAASMTMDACVERTLEAFGRALVA